MATLTVDSACPGGNHVTITVTLTGGQQITEKFTRDDFAGIFKEVTRREFIKRQVASRYVAAFPSIPPSTLNQLRAAIATGITYLE